MLPWLGGSFMFAPLYPHTRRDGQTTADGGRPARLDVLMDSDRAAGPRGDRKAEEARSRNQKLFCINAETRQGGSGLYTYRKGEY